jgi:YcxB-like protein
MSAGRALARPESESVSIRRDIRLQGIRMSPTSIKIEYSSLRSEVWSFYWRSWRQRWWKVHLLVFSSVTAVAFVGLYRQGLSPFSEGALACGCGFLSIVWMPIYPLLKFKPQTRILEIGAAGISTTIGKISGQRSWHEIASITQSDGNIVILGKNGNAFIVPPRAFDSENARQAFLTFAQNALAAARQNLVK